MKERKLFISKRMIVCGSNNYLGLAHPGKAAIKPWNGFHSCTGSRFLKERWNCMSRLKRLLTLWKGKLIFMVCETNLVYSALISRDDVVIWIKRTMPASVERVWDMENRTFPIIWLAVGTSFKIVPEDRGS